MKRLLIPLRIAVGGVIFIIGIAGLFLPIIPGIAFMIWGASLMSPRHGALFVDKIRSYWQRLMRRR